MCPRVVACLEERPRKRIFQSLASQGPSLGIPNKYSLLESLLDYCLICICFYCTEDLKQQRSTALYLLACLRLPLVSAVPESATSMNHAVRYFPEPTWPEQWTGKEVAGGCADATRTSLAPTSPRVSCLFLYARLARKERLAAALGPPPGDCYRLSRKQLGAGLRWRSSLLAPPLTPPPSSLHPPSLLPLTPQLQAPGPLWNVPTAMELGSSMAMELGSSTAMELGSFMAMELGSSMAMELGSSMAMELGSSMAMELGSSMAMELGSSMADKT